MDETSQCIEKGDIEKGKRGKGKEKNKSEEIRVQSTDSFSFTNKIIKQIERN
jgi:hypothetical protein